MLWQHKGCVEGVSNLPLGGSDHNAVHLVPLFKQQLKTSKPELRTIEIWKDEPVDCLRGCFDCTVWDTLIDTSGNLNELSAVVTDYIHFCVDSVYRFFQMTDHG